MFIKKTPAEIAAMTDVERESYSTAKDANDAAILAKAVQDKADEVKTELTAEFAILTKASNDRMDELEALADKAKNTKYENLDLAGRLAKGFGESAEQLSAFKKGDGSLTVKVPALMTTPTNLTGEGVITYAPNAVILPGAPINARDLIPIVRSESGIYATYAETGGEGEVDFQSAEGAKKPFLDVDLSQIKTVTRVIAGTLDFSRQMTKHLPFLQGTLARILTRKFYEKENAYLYATLAAAATGGTAPVAGTVAVGNLIGYVMEAFDSNFVPSYIVIKGADYGAIAQTNIMNSPFGLVYNQATGRAEIAGIPVIMAPWAVAGKALIFDRDYVELVVTEDISVRFSEENKDNFEKNVITARIEAMEELNVIYPQSVVYQDLAGAEVPAG